jgi:glucose-6-phosphate isomerase
VRELPAEYLLGPLEEAVHERLSAVERERFAERIWQKDGGLWKRDPPAQRAIVSRLGWLGVADTLRGNLASVHRLVEQVRSKGFGQTVVLGMGGASATAEMFARAFGQRAGFLRPSVLDSVVPATVRAAEAAMNLPHTLFVVASKSGSTRETLALFSHFQEQLMGEVLGGHRADPPGRHFVAITDAGSPLETLARQEAFRETFVNPSDIGGRFSALSLFGIVPAALAGVDVGLLLLRASEMAGLSREAAARDNPPLRLGVVLGEAERAGRDKLTFVASPAAAPFGAWMEQLIAGSTGKDARGLVPIDGEPLGEVSVYGDDRLFVGLLLGEDDPMEARLRGLADAGHPVVLLHLSDSYDLGAEIFRWEFATAVAGALLGVNPFDKPGVDDSKARLAKILDGDADWAKVPGTSEVEIGAAAGIRVLGRPDEKGTGRDLSERLRAFLAEIPPRGYLSIQAYLPASPGLASTLEQLRLRLRNRTRAAVTLGMGPRVVHTTGQLHKGGPPTGAFVQITGDAGSVGAELPVPGSSQGFGRLLAAQAEADRQMLHAQGRNLLHLRLVGEPREGLSSLLSALP